MTMFSDQQFYGACYGFTIYDQGCKRFDLANYQGPLMAEDEARIASQGDESTQEERDEGWLRLSIGSCHAGVTVSEENRQRDVVPGLELELLPSSSSSSKAHKQIRPEMRHVTNFLSTSIGFTPSFLFQCPENSSTSNIQRHQEMNWALRPVIPSNTTLPSSSFTTPFSYPSTTMATGSYFPTRSPFQIYEPMSGPRPGLDFRVVPPPRRPHSGIWFMLQASKNIVRELSLPQISKRYLRIKDMKMTIRLVIKYLVNKLSMENDSEVEITCKGQRLEPFMTLQHVRDNIWMNTNRDNNYITLLPNSSTHDHIMVLNYARIPSSNS